MSPLFFAAGQPGMEPARVPLYSVTYLELAAIAIFLILSALSFFRRRTPDAFLIFLSAVFFALKPVLIFAIPSKKIFALAVYFPTLALACLIAVVCLRHFRSDPPKG